MIVYWPPWKYGRPIVGMAVSNCEPSSTPPGARHDSIVFWGTGDRGPLCSQLRSGWSNLGRIKQKPIDPLNIHGLHGAARVCVGEVVVNDSG
jgi:hypothetical protein